MIAAVYTVLCVVLAPISYGTVQIRISEALTLFAVFSPEAIVGVTIGCFLSNLIASAPVDMVFGTLATLVAGILTYRLRHLRTKGLAIAASIPPVIVNALVVGAELTLLYYPKGSPFWIWLINITSVGAGQIISCSTLGVFLIYLIERNPRLLSIMKDS